MTAIVVLIAAASLAAGRMPVRPQPQAIAHRVSPEYPKLAKAARIQGTVTVAALIDDEGIVQELRLISGHPLLVKATFDAVKQWRYRPAKLDGSPVPSATIVEISFTMTDWKINEPR